MSARAPRYDVVVPTAGRPALDVLLAALAAADGAREGTVLRVPLGPDGAPEWERATVDAAEQEQRRNELRARADRLTASDDGGDLAL